MRLSIACCLLSVTTVCGFAPATGRTQSLFDRSLEISRPQTLLWSTLAPQTPKEQVDGGNFEQKGPLSMQIDELAHVLGGKGRAQIVWDCYSIVRRTCGR